MSVIRTTVLSLGIAALAVSATAQTYWPKPAATPGVDVRCTGCVGTHNGLLTPGYPPTLGKFVGRFLDSEATQDFQSPFRTVRSFYVIPARSLNRLYMIIGSAAMAYNMDTFFTRVIGGEPLVQGGQRGYGSLPDLYLNNNSFFYAENSESGWHMAIPDGQERLFGLDYDDQGYVYLAYSLYGWGIVKDDMGSGGNLMHNQIQWYAQDTADDVFPPYKIAALKSSNGHYYALVAGKSPGINIFDVTDRTSPMRVQTLATRSLGGFAKTTAADRIGISTLDGKLQIFSTDGIVTGGQPIYEVGGAGGPVGGVAGDGTNFFTASDTGNGLVISVFSPSGNSSNYRRVGDYPGLSRTLTGTLNLSWGDGFLVWVGVMNGVANLRLFKLQNGVPVEIDLQDYFKNYYTSAKGPGYTYPAFSYFYDSTVIKRGTHTYLVAMGYSLGDIYEIPSTDSVAVNTVGVTGSVNPTVPSGSGSGPFPGDPVTFNATTGAASPMNINWDFGDGTGVTPGLTGTQVTHQYSGAILAGGSSKTVSVSATNATDSSITSAVNVTVQKPTPRFGVGNYKYLFLQPNASSPAPIVAGDNFFDASDGTIQSHFDTWNVDSGTLNTLPSGGAPAGVCGQHTLNFTAHYGPYSSTSMTSLGTDLPVGISPFVYAVRPFAAAIDAPTSTTSASNSACTDPLGCVVFSSLSRFSSDTSVLASSASLTYRWEILNGTTPLTAQSGVTTPGTVPVFVVPKTMFSGTPNLKAHLILTATSGVGSTCAGFASSDAFTGPLSVPDPVIQGGCGANGTQPCSFSVSSLSGADTSGWTYQWSITPNDGTASPATSVAAVYSPVFTNPSQQTYTISLVATNSIGPSLSATKQVTVAAAPQCGQMNASNVFIHYVGATSGCSETNSSVSCIAGEQVNLTVSAFGYDFTCANHTFTWSFGGTGRSVTHSFSATTTVSVTIANPIQTYTPPTATITVGGYTPPPPPPPPPPTGGSCLPMSASNVFIHYVGSTSGCTETNTAVNCIAGEQVALSVTGFGYDFTCAQHQYSWSFGASGKQVTSSFSSTTGVSCVINNGSQTYTATATIPVGSGGTPPPTGGSCIPMTASNVFIHYSGPSTGCSETNTAVSCSSTEAVQLTVSGFGYDFTCANHTYTWSFGKTGKTTSNTFSSTSQISVLVNNGSQSFTAYATIPVGSGGTPPPSGSCGTLAPNTSVYISYTGPQSGCNQYGSTDCNTIETIPFQAKGFNFDLSCLSAYDWDYGDGTPHGTGAQVTHRYISAGAFPMKLVVTYSGVAYTITQTVKVAGTTPGGPGPNYQFDFTTSPITGIPNAYTFHAFSTTNAASSTAYNWDFGDGQTCLGCGATVQHIYFDSKNYSVTLSVPGYSGSVEHGVLDKTRRRPSHP